MKIELNKKVFLPVISKAVNFTEKGETSVIVELTAGEAVIKGADSNLNQIYLAKYDLTVEDPICKIEGEGKLIFTQKLETIVKKLPKDDVTLQVEEGTVTVKQGKTKASVTIPTEFIEIIEPTGDTQEPLDLPKNVFAILANATLFATATKDVRPALKGIHIKASENGFEVIGTDSHRLGRFLLKQEIKFPEVTIPANSVKDVLNLFDDDTKIRLTPMGANYMLFEAEGQKVYIRLLQGEYPDTSRLINEDEINNAKKYSIATAEIINTLDLISTISSDNDKNIFTIKPTQTGLEFSANSESGQMNIDIPTQVDTHFEGEITLNLKYFKEAVLSHKGEEVVLHVNGAARPMFVMSKNERITQLVLPVRK